MMNKEKVAAMREDYRYEEFGEEDLKTKEPFGLFDLWFRMAVDTFTDRIGEANAMTLSTASK